MCFCMKEYVFPVQALMSCSLPPALYEAPVPLMTVISDKVDSASMTSAGLDTVLNVTWPFKYGDFYTSPSQKMSQSDETHVAYLLPRRP